MSLPSDQAQQAPLALTSQPQLQAQVRPQLPTPQLQSQVPTTMSQPIGQQIQSKIQTCTLPIATAIATPTAQPITIATSSSGPTALVIIPQSTGATVAATKTSAIATKPNQNTPTIATPTTHVTLPTTTQPTPIPPQTPIVVPHVTSITPIPVTAHQQSPTVVQPALANRPPSLPIVPMTAAPANVKPEPNKYICCLLDNGQRCDRIAGNASFSARIQKIVGTKKMNFALDSTVRHAYICDHHKAIITVAKKSTPLARDTKSNARNYTANNSASVVAQQTNSNFNNIAQQQILQHPMSMDMIGAQNRLATHHAGPMNNLPGRPGARIAYAHYPGAHPNQAGPMDVMMTSSFDKAGGDSMPSGSGGVDVDLQQLQVNTLRRYKRHFRVQTRPGLNKMQLAESLKNHFKTLPIIEKEAITYFVYIVKCYRNKLDHNPKAD